MVIACNLGRFALFVALPRPVDVALPKHRGSSPPPRQAIPIDQCAHSTHTDATASARWHYVSGRQHL